MSGDERMSLICYIAANPEVGVLASSNLRSACCGGIIAV